MQRLRADVFEQAVGRELVVPGIDDLLRLAADEHLMMRPLPKRPSHEPSACLVDMRAMPLSAWRSMVTSSAVPSRGGCTPSARHTSQVPQGVLSVSPK
jgi:hypothetical protein